MRPGESWPCSSRECHLLAGTGHGLPDLLESATGFLCHLGQVTGGVILKSIKATSEDRLSCLVCLSQLNSSIEMNGGFFRSPYLPN